MPPRIDRVVTSGTFSLDGQDFDVDNNIWLIGDDDEVLVVDAAHDAAPISVAIADRRVAAIVCTHGHNDHITAARELSAAHGNVPILLHNDDLMLWSDVYPDHGPDGSLDDGQRLSVAGSTLEARHTPGHSPGGVCLVASDFGCVFSGDTLFQGGPGATGRSYSDKPTLLASIRSQLLSLPPETVVHTGHGDDTTIGAEAPGVLSES